jgi:hypothetical protein
MSEEETELETELEGLQQSTVTNGSAGTYLELLNEQLPVSPRKLWSRVKRKKPKHGVRQQQEQQQQQQQPISPAKVYVAKSLVLISRLEYVDLFRACLSLFYGVYVDKRHSADNRLLETMVANLLTAQVHAPGTALASSFSLGADDRHLVQATASLQVPATGSAVVRLFQAIGVANVVKLVCAIMADFKVLFFSRSYTKLYDACRALEALLFPLKYTGKFSPIAYVTSPLFQMFLQYRVIIVYRN